MWTMWDPYLVTPRQKDSVFWSYQKICLKFSFRLKKNLLQRFQRNCFIKWQKCGNYIAVKMATVKWPLNWHDFFSSENMLLVVAVVACIILYVLVVIPFFKRGKCDCKQRLFTKNDFKLFSTIYYIIMTYYLFQILVT